MVVVPRAARAPFSLRRVEPSAHAGVIYLTRPSYTVGRGRDADLPLFSPTASRAHARLDRRLDGWYLEPCAGKAVIVNGSVVRSPVRLKHTMHRQMAHRVGEQVDEHLLALAALLPNRRQCADL